MLRKAAAQWEKNSGEDFTQYSAGKMRFTSTGPALQDWRKGMLMRYTVKN
jgi:hypothetical protein